MRPPDLDKPLLVSPVIAWVALILALVELLLFR